MSKKEHESNITEDANVVGSGAIAGLGIGPQGEPGVTPKHKVAVVIHSILRRKNSKTLG